MTEQEEDDHIARHPFSGAWLRLLRSTKVEEFLAGEPFEYENAGRHLWRPASDSRQGCFDFAR